jgi:hypothetical protein
MAWGKVVIMKKGKKENEKEKEKEKEKEMILRYFT